MVDRMKLPVHFFTSSITTIPVTIAITIDAIAVTNEEVENVCTADNYIRMHVKLKNTPPTLIPRLNLSFDLVPGY